MVLGFFGLCGFFFFGLLFVCLFLRASGLYFLPIGIRNQGKIHYTVCILPKSRSEMSLGVNRFFLKAVQEAGFPGGSEGKETACNVEDLGLIPGLGRYPGGGHGNPL